MKKSPDELYGDQEEPIPRSDIFGYRENARDSAVVPIESWAPILSPMPGAGSQYSKEELAGFRDRLAPKPALAVKPTAPIPEKKLAPERFSYKWSPGKTPSALSEEAHGKILDFRYYCERYEGNHLLPILAYHIVHAPQLKNPPFTGNILQVVGHYVVNLRTNDGKNFNQEFPLYAS